MRVSVSSSQSVNRFKNTFHWSPSANAVGLLCFSLSALCTYTITRRESKRLRDGFRTFSAVFRTASGTVSAASGFIARRRGLCAGASCILARLFGSANYGTDTSSRVARVHRRVGVRTGVCCSQSRFCLRIAEIPPKSQRVCPDCNVPARMAAFSSELRISFRIARFSCELPIYSRMTACLLGRRGFSFSCGNFSRTAVCLRDWRVHAGLLGVLYRDIGGGYKAANSANGGAVGLTAGSWRDGELGDGLSAGTTAVSTANFQLARGGGELGFRLGCKSCVRCVKCTVLQAMRQGAICLSGNARFLYAAVLGS